MRRKMILRSGLLLLVGLLSRMPLHADANSDAPQAKRVIKLPFGTVDAVSGGLSLNMPLGPRLPGRIPLGFSWSFGSQEGDTQQGGHFRPIEWPNDPALPQTTVRVGGEPWVFYPQSAPASMPSATTLLQWAKDRGVGFSPAALMYTSTMTAQIQPSSDGTKFYAVFYFQGESSTSSAASKTNLTPSGSSGLQPNLTPPPQTWAYWTVLSEDSAIWSGGGKALTPGPVSHFTNRWGDAVTVTESNDINGCADVPGTIVISNDNRPAQTITLTITGTAQTTSYGGVLQMTIPNASLVVDNTLVGNDGMALPKVQVTCQVNAGQWAPGSPYNEGMSPGVVAVQPKDGTAPVSTNFDWTRTMSIPATLTVTLPSGLKEVFTVADQRNWFWANRANYWAPGTGYWVGIQAPPSPQAQFENIYPAGVQQVAISGAGSGRCYMFIPSWPSIHPNGTYTIAPHTTTVLTYGTDTPTANDAFRGYRLIHPSSYAGMMGDTSTHAYLFATSAILAEEEVHGKGLPGADSLGQPTEPASTMDQRTIYDGWSLKSWANPTGALSTSNGIPVTAVAWRSRTWTPSTGLLGPLPDKTVIAGNADAWGPTTTDEYIGAPSTPPTVDASTVGVWSNAIPAPTGFTTHRTGVITRTWNDSGLMRALTKTDHKTLADVGSSKMRYSAPGVNLPPSAGLSSVDFGTTTYGYDAQGRITSESGQRGSYTATESRAYTITNASGKPQPLLSDTIKTLLGPSGNIPANPNASVTVGSTYTYSDPLVQSGPSTVVDKVDGRTESFSYDGLGRVTSHTDVLGITTTTHYDAWGRVNTVTRQPHTNGASTVGAMTATTVITPDGLQKTETVVSDGITLTTVTVYDAFGRKVSVTNPDLSTQTFQYNGFDQLIAASPVLKTGQTSWGNETWAYDAIGRETDHWDAQGRLLQHVVQQPAWMTISGLTGIWTTTQDDRGFTRSEGHDLLGQKLGIVDQAGQLSQYWYDQDGHLLETQQGSQYRSYTYNDMGWLTSRTEPEEGQTLYANFNLLGTPLTTTQKGRSGVRTNTFTTTLDAHLQPTQITATGPEGTVTRTLTYDGATHLLTGVSEAQANGTLTESYPIATAYDGLYRLVGKAVSDGTQSFTVSQTLDAAGRQLSLTYPTAAGRADQTVMVPDTLGRPATVTLNGETHYSGFMVYDQVAGTAVTNTLTFGNNAWTTSKVDKGELTHVTHTAAAGVLEDDAVTWTAGGLMLSRGTDTFGYDALQRLSSAHVLNPADGSFVDQGFSYDRYGNRTATATTYGGAVPTNNEALTWTANTTSGNDLPATVTAASGALNTGAIYDDLGRLSQVWTTPGQSSTLTTWVYDPSGRVVAENGTSYLLDSAGLRFRRTKADGSITYTVYGFSREPLSVFTKAPAGSLAWSKTMVYGFGQLLREEDSVQGTTYDQSDQVGSPNYLTGPTGLLVGRAKTLAFGEQLYQWGAKSSRRFTNHEQDPDSNAIYMQAREYLAAYGKFAEVDPAYDQTKDDPESWNLYNYTTNNPVTHTDPDGRMAPAAQNQAWNDYYESVFGDALTGNLSTVHVSPGQMNGIYQAIAQHNTDSNTLIVLPAEDVMPTVTFTIGSAQTDPTHTITLKNGINPDSVSWESRLTLTTAMDASSVTAITITDTARTNEQQAGAMYNNAVKDLAYQMKLYDSSGKAVLNTFKAAQDAGKSKSDTIAAMTQTIGEVKLAHPTAFKHTADPMVTGTMDISLSSIKPASARDSFMKELGIRGARTILEPQNHCLHVEIPQMMPWPDPFGTGL